jgi:hypothetical protein
LDELKEDVKNDPWIQEQICKLDNSPFLVKHYSIENGVLCYNGRIAVRPTPLGRTIS